MLMHADLHCLPHRPQLRHFSVLITGAKTLKRDTNPSTVPTGHIVLHHVLPFFHARIATTMKVTAATANVAADLIHTSVL
jgi:hypothetical protein